MHLALRALLRTKKVRSDTYMKEKTFYAAMYLRLSRDDEEKQANVKAESGSITGQRELIRSFISEQPDMELYDSYVDDGWSGGNFVEVR